MKKVKLLMIGVALACLSVMGFSNFGLSEAEAQGSTTYCQWNGEDCKSPSENNYCGCEKGDGRDN